MPYRYYRYCMKIYVYFAPLFFVRSGSGLQIRDKTSRIRITGFFHLLKLK
jgi:hypothetical protein